jgi:hypothetical protein
VSKSANLSGDGQHKGAAPVALDIGRGLPKELHKQAKLALVQGPVIPLPQRTRGGGLCGGSGWLGVARWPWSNPEAMEWSELQARARRIHSLCKYSCWVHSTTTKIGISIKKMEDKNSKIYFTRK